jgi:hypothetical protein
MEDFGKDQRLLGLLIQKNSAPRAVLEIDMNVFSCRNQASGIFPSGFADTEIRGDPPRKSKFHFQEIFGFQPVYSVDQNEFRNTLLWGLHVWES